MPRGFEKTMQRRYWLTEVEAGGALAAFEHQHPDIGHRRQIRRRAGTHQVHAMTAHTSRRANDAIRPGRRPDRQAVAALDC